MLHQQRRVLSILAAASAALAIGASPALAGSSGCAGGDCQDEDQPARVVPAVPTPVPLAAPQLSGGVAPEHAQSEAPTSHAKPKKKRRRVVRVTGTRTRHSTVNVPRGAVAAGAGGTARQDPDGLIALAGAGLLMLAAGGTMVASGRRAGS
jgi:hypothetical protein